jgi:3-oxoacyl-[acyl-carrier-protein] synthase-1
VKTRAVVASVGARTPLGLSAMPTAFVYRTATAAMRASPLLDPEGEPATMCFLPTLEPRSVGSERALELALPAMKEAVEALGPQTLRFKLWLCLDEELGIKADGRLPSRDLLDALVRRAASFVELEDAIATARGPATLGLVLDDVVAELERGNITAAIVGGVHSDYHPARIAALAAAGRLFSVDNLDALIPGECAAFSVIMHPSAARAQRLAVRAQIHAWAATMERARPDNDVPAFEANGMTAAVRKASEPLVEHDLRCGWLLTDASFETMRAYELQAVSIRTQKLWCEPQHVDAPAQRMGYLGAAALPLHLVIAAEAWRRGWAPHARAMAQAGSDGGERAALLLSMPP